MNRLLRITSVVLGLSFSILVACDKSDDPQVLPCLLTSQTQLSFTYKFDYDGEFVRSFTTINPVASQSTIMLEYDDYGHIVALKYPNNMRSTFKYSGNFIIKRENFLDGILTDQIEYQYSEDRLVKIQEYDNVNSDLRKSEYRILEYDGDSKNIVRIKRFPTPTSSTHDDMTQYTYDDKRATLSAVPEALQRYYLLEGVSAENNITKITFGNGAEINYTYEYNDMGYPIKRTQIPAPEIVLLSTYRCK
jgi:hypothetical protein